jgi:putative transposase
VPGPRAILYYLHRDSQFGEQAVELPRSTRTVWRILDRNGRIVRKPRPDHEPVERPTPLTEWQLDFKDASTVPADPEGKRQHVVEVLDTLDVGTSILLGAAPRDDYTAETSLYAMADLLREQGLPDRVTFDRDARFVGAVQARDFPAPFVRFWLCLGVSVTVCPPHHPQSNGFVERYHRSYTEECLRVARPRTVEDVRTVTAAYREHYNYQRPNQALSCGNRPPRVAFPALPARPSVPLLVDPDAWLETIDGRAYVRRVQENGCVVVGDAIYYVGRDRGGQEVALIIDARAREFVVVQAGQELKRLAIKGLHRRIVPFDAFIELLATQARDNRNGRLGATG